MTSIEVFRTNIDDLQSAKDILEAIRQQIPGSEPSLDLEDCDKVLRVESKGFGIDESVIKKIVTDFKFEMEVLP